MSSPAIAAVVQRRKPSLRKEAVFPGGPAGTPHLDEVQRLIDFVLSRLWVNARAGDSLNCTPAGPHGRRGCP